MKTARPQANTPSTARLLLYLVRARGTGLPIGMLDVCLVIEHRATETAAGREAVMELERLAPGIYWDSLPFGGMLYLPEPEGTGLALDLEVVIGADGVRARWLVEGEEVQKVRLPRA